MMFLFKKEKKPTILTIHGFGKKLHHEFDPFSEYFTSKNYEVIQFDIYDIDNGEDADPKVWINRCENQVKALQTQKKEIILIGFSMGGVIASYLASIYKIKKLILCSPAFYYLDLQKIANYGIKTVKKLYSNEDVIEKPSSAQTSCFQEIVHDYRESIFTIDCPIYMIHGSEDEVIPLDSSKNVYKRIESQKFMLTIESGKHRMLYDGKLQDHIFPIIETFL